MKNEKQDKQNKRANALRENLKRRKSTPQKKSTGTPETKKVEKESK